VVYLVLEMTDFLLKGKSDLDFGSLEPGDLLLVANPTEPLQLFV